MSVGTSLVAWRSRQDIHTGCTGQTGYFENCGLICFCTSHNFVNVPHFSHSPNFGRPKQGQTFVVPTFHICLLLLDMSTFDFFLNLQIHLPPTYFSLSLSSWIVIVINWYFSQFAILMVVTLFLIEMRFL